MYECMAVGVKKNCVIRKIHKLQLRMQVSRVDFFLSLQYLHESAGTLYMLLAMLPIAGFNKIVSLVLKIITTKKST
jgi:hypothetical protein